VSDPAEILQALRGVDDPELGINIVDLGLVYRTALDGGRARVEMTMTSRACPLGEYLTDRVRAAIAARFPEVHDIDVTLVWDPPWRPEMMTDAARRRLR
jgi:metal-sulfur cluster biosynthetic enzyme